MFIFDTCNQRKTKDFTISYTIFGSDGIVLDIEVRDDETMFWDCNFWSCYVHEDERLLIGGLQSLQFETIRNIKQSEDYDQYIKTLNIMHCMLTGYRTSGIKPDGTDMEVLQQIIDFKVDGVDTGIPKYMQSFIRHFLSRVTYIVINLGDWKMHFIDYWMGLRNYGFKKFAKIFSYNEEDGTFNFELLMKLFTNTTVVTVINVESPTKANPSMKLTDNFAVNLRKCIDFLNTGSVSSSCSRFEIVKPSSSTNAFIEKNKNEFENKGWKLKYERFNGTDVWAKFNKEKMLLIEKLPH